MPTSHVDVIQIKFLIASYVIMVYMVFFPNKVKNVINNEKIKKAESET
jgi:hypothetical protein